MHSSSISGFCHFFIPFLNLTEILHSWSPTQEALHTIIISAFRLRSPHQIVQAFIHTSLDAIKSLLKYTISCTVTVLPCIIFQHMLKLTSSFRLFQHNDFYDELGLGFNPDIVYLNTGMKLFFPLTPECLNFVRDT